MNYEARHEALITYLLAKVDERDWHGVSDAANDLRVLEAKGAATDAGDSGRPQISKAASMPARP